LSATKIKIRKVANITLWWILINILFGLYNHSIIHSNFVVEVSDIYNIWLSIMANVVSAFLAGLLGASLLVFVVYEKFRKRPYIQGVLAASGTFIVIFYIITPIVAVFYYIGQSGDSMFSKAARSAVIEQVTSPTVTTYMIVWALLIAATWLVIQISEKFGPGVLWKLIRGHYQFPKQEDRVFMFIDLKSSTTLAEQLGNEKYFGLLQEFFSDITDPVINTHGEIYQYVGDEVVITWPLSRGIRNNNCLECYISIRQIVEDKREDYLNSFGVVPQFRAGLHYGKVITGEIGIIKKDIAFSGDVLNTTARITEECKKYGTDLISSEILAECSSKHGISARYSL
jgi:adenylate cyclase